MYCLTLPYRGTIAAIPNFDVSGSEALTAAVIVALIALVPILGTLAITIIQQYGRVREAWAIANANHLAIHNQILPQLERLQTEGEAQHAETIKAINGGLSSQAGGPGNGSSSH